MMEFTRIAVKKVNQLISMDDAIEFHRIDGEKVVIKFADKLCTVDSFGGVTWEAITKRSNQH